MTIVISRASQQYAARQNPYSANATVPAGATVNRVKVTLTRESWPAGPVGSVTLNFPDGTTAGFSFNGGDIPNRDGTGTLAASSCEFSRQDSNGIYVPFPVGSYSIDFKVLQTLTTAVTVERF